ncbi:Hsp20/alpha crystallin family protein [Maricurvus nonylphenolicus]|uniref:Hsp20/alpha crystallin family protein n=1 Tax=Maricurvus nonylphenolicus TaxID=1008307 RepID=UPI0036F1E920
MSLIPRNRPLGNSLFDFDNFFDQVWGNRLPETSFSPTTFSPRIDVREHDGHYEISAELPGVDKDDLSVTLDNGVLTIEAETHQEDKEEKEGKLIRQERRYGKFMRSFNLGSDVREKDINASFKDGVLTLTAPKREETVSQSRRIDIH